MTAERRARAFVRRASAYLLLGAFAALASGVILPSRLRHGTVLRHPPAVPYRPIWTGLAVDALLFGMAASFVASKLGALRAAARRRRGLCAACGARAATMPRCPECGRS